MGKASATREPPRARARNRLRGGQAQHRRKALGENGRLRSHEPPSAGAPQLGGRVDAAAVHRLPLDVTDAAEEDVQFGNESVQLELGHDVGGPGYGMGAPVGERRAQLGQRRFGARVLVDPPQRRQNVFELSARRHATQA